MAKKKKIKTKDRILDKAIEIYNQHGIQNITSRHIAAELGISYGNLDYHYNTKETLILAIYELMREEMSKSYINSKDYATPFEHLHRLVTHLERFQYKYRFFVLDIVEITRQFPKINRLVNKTNLVRKQQLDQIFTQCIEGEFLITIDPSAYKQMLSNLRIIITYWVSQQLVFSNPEHQNIGEMSKHAWQLLHPYMTDKGKDEYERLITKYGHDS